MFGLYWRTNLEERLFQGSGTASGYVVYLRGDGAVWYFQSSGTSTWKVASPTNEAATLTLSGTIWTLLFRNGEKRTFSSASGSLQQIIDRNSNITQLSYDGMNRLVGLTDPSNRHLYFGYAGNNALATSVTSDVGISLGYEYDGQGRLVRVIKPDQSVFVFNHNDQSLITSVTDSDGKILESHTYDSRGRGLSSSRANGVEAITVSYPN
jgi:YD repeat-containing protein